MLCIRTASYQIVVQDNRIYLLVILEYLRQNLKSFVTNLIIYYLKMDKFRLALEDRGNRFELKVGHEVTRKLEFSYTFTIECSNYLVYYL